ncbi:uncharacterized protein [Epargyreus clarus]|uniref:uncharacterized protein n=1 Tax=Epargyreus clarus TaxID=520877 RepID=UPI003C2E96E9
MKMWLKFLLVSIFGCCSTVTSSLDLGGVVSGNRMAGVPLGLSLGDGEVDVEGICSMSGLTCQNCTHEVTCIPLPVGWLKVPLQACREGQTCNARNGGCSSKPVPECDSVRGKYKHTCEQVGIFPDAYDCRKFHLCSPPAGSPGGSPADHRVGLCPRNYGYNPRTAQCSIKLNKGQCTSTPAPLCTKVGDFGVLPSSPNHYYVCLSKQGVLYPQIFICPHGWFFWEGFCRPEPENPEISTNKEDTTEAATTEKTTTRIESFFSTEKTSTVKPDTFLADKFDLAAYDTIFGKPADEEIVETNEYNSWEGFDK